jgi:TetR/AcrR family transcriptional repressor of nem operon
MTRPKEFDKDEALEAAINVFRKHGFAGTSTSMLTAEMKIGRQSLYDTFGDKWKLYCAALQRYATVEIQAHIAVLRSAPRAINGIRKMIERVVAEARMPCLGISSVSEFGDADSDLTKLRATAAKALRIALVNKIKEAQLDGDISASLDSNHAASFLHANVAAIRLAARGGASDVELHALGKFILQALK